MKLILVGSGIFLLVLSVSAGTFVETFGDRKLGEWQELVQLENEPGSWEVINGELHAVSRGTIVRLLTTGDDSWTNYTLELDVKPSKKHGLGAIVIAARMSQTWAMSCQIEDYVRLVEGRAIAGEWVSCWVRNWHDVNLIQLHSEPHPLLRLKKWAHLKLSVEDDNFTFWINGKRVVDPTKIQNIKDIRHFEGAPDFLTGGVGFGLANYTAVFDNIIITGDSIPNREQLSVTPSAKLAVTWGDLKVHP